jgi:fructosamine-3-kinase
VTADQPWATNGVREWTSDLPAGVPGPVSTSPVGGGYICSTQRATLADGRDVIIKRCPYPAAQEAEGLRALAAAGIPTPAVIGVGPAVLVLEHVSGPPDWAGLGRAIARLHRHTGESFGWSGDNYAGLITQDNRWCDDWPTFYAQRRVLGHLAHADVPDPLRHRLERACAGPLPALLRQHPPASLTHGDLWAGNVIAGHWLVDPAVSYADRELDLAYMRRSPDLPAELFEAYEAEWPVDPSFEQRRPALGLHKLLVNVRHFGPRFVPRIEETLDGYGW